MDAKINKLIKVIGFSLKDALFMQMSTCRFYFIWFFSWYFILGCWLHFTPKMGGATTVAQCVGIFNPLGGGGGMGPIGDKRKNLGEYYYYYYYYY